ncbi:hypothetical protein GGI1_18114 [Acidithiobacillus sp. GGI-221]|nr:hypothetical protein GGI1_18114 [Acidithiobacillus sp. GGI-221]
MSVGKSTMVMLGGSGDNPEDMPCRRGNTAAISSRSKWATLAPRG